jgi:hypothetical protein
MDRMNEEFGDESKLEDDEGILVGSSILKRYSFSGQSSIMSKYKA